MRTTLLTITTFFLALGARSQCTWTQYFFDSFEYTTAVPHIVPGMVYYNTPVDYNGSVHAGSRGLRLDFMDEVIGLVYDQPFTNLCAGSEYRFSLWARNTMAGNSNMTYRVLDASGTVLCSQQVTSAATWTELIFPQFTATGTIRFQIILNLPGSYTDDLALDELKLSICTPELDPNLYTSTVNECQITTAPVNLYDELASPMSDDGTWSGPSNLTNGHFGTFTPGTSINGTYTYTIDGGNCPDSIATVHVSIFRKPNIDSPIPVTACQSYTLPAITGTSLSGNQHYYTQPNGGGSVIQTGTAITSSQTVYLHDGVPGCSDDEVLIITIIPSGNAGSDGVAAFCGAGPQVQLNGLLSATVTQGGTWAETTIPASGTFNSTTGVWNTASLNPGTFTFSYTVAANGICPPDQATFSFYIGELPAANLGNDTTICENSSLTLNPGAFDSYLWSTGATTSSIIPVYPGGTYWVTVSSLGMNQVINGDFESGNTGFTTQNTLGTGGPSGLISYEGNYAIVNSPNQAHNAFISCSDHTPNPGTKQLVVNGSGASVSKVWCQTVPVEPGRTYRFGTWVSAANSDPSIADLQLTINNLQLGNVFSPTLPAGTWSEFFQTWQSNSLTNAEICIVNLNNSLGGNDFMLDDISFRPICLSTDSVEISYSELPEVMLGPDQNHCEGTTVTLNAGNSGMNYLWNTGETSQTITVTSTGNHSVTVTNALGCSGSDAVSVNFEEQKYAGSDGSDAICSTDSQFNLADLLSATATSGGTWSSMTPSFTGVVSTNGATQLTGQAGTFEFGYIVYGTYCPNDSALFQVTIHQQSVAAQDQSFHFCDSITGTIDFTPYRNHPYEPLSSGWETSMNVPSGSFDPGTSTFSLQGLAAGTYSFYDILPSEEGCVSDTMQIDVAITEMPVVDFSADAVEGCTPMKVTFTDQSGTSGNLEYVWQFGTGDVDVTAGAVEYTYNSAGNFDVTLTVIADGLCSASGTIPSMILVHDLPVAYFNCNPQEMYTEHPLVNFVNESDYYTSSSWSFGDGETSIEEHPEHQFPEGVAAHYPVQLVVTNEYGCADTIIRIVIVNEEVVYYVPNSFTPNNDPINPIFIPVMTAGIDENDYSLDIYDRWGELVFSTIDIHEGWDGTYRGAIAKEGTYTWRLRFGLKENDGVETAVGQVTVLR